MITIGDIISYKEFGYYSRLIIDICPTCDKAYPTIVDMDPGSTAEAIGYIQICDDCYEDYRAGKIDMGCHTDWDKIIKIRKDRGLGDYREKIKAQEYIWEEAEIRGKYPKHEFEERMCGNGDYEKFIKVVLKHSDYTLDDYAHDVYVEECADAYFSMGQVSERNEKDLTPAEKGVFVSDF